MRIAITGATGFLGRYLVGGLADAGHRLRCWHRPESDRSGFEVPPEQLEWCPGQLGDAGDAKTLVDGCDAVVHAALWRPGKTFRGGEGDVLRFVDVNVMGTLQLIEAARAAGASRFVFISTCAVHEEILDDRPLDETHPLWPHSHYGAHKAAIEKFVHSYGLGQGYPICALRPTGIYGLDHPPGNSKWFSLVRSVVAGETVTCRNGGKEVHAADVARAVEILLNADSIAGQAYNCYDRYVSDLEAARLARTICGSSAEIHGETREPKHQIVTDKLRTLGMEFGGPRLLEQTIRQLVQAALENK
jgi:nucleoside-diphosphate-sugar epimerase